MPVHQGYGLTEAAPIVTSTLASTAPVARARSGRALPGVGLRLVDDLGHDPEPGDPGEIQVRGDNLFAGYWPDGSDGPGADGWWSTGDIGFLDDGGDLFIVDRAAEVVVVAGFRVYPSEVEAVVGAVPDVAEVAVIGVPDDATGSAVVAYVRAPGADAGRSSRTPYAVAARPSWPGSSGRRASRSSTSCRPRWPAGSARARCASSSAAGRWGSSSDRLGS